MSILNPIVTGGSAEWEVSPCSSYSDTTWEFPVSHEPSEWFVFYTGGGYVSSITPCLTWASSINSPKAWRCLMAYGTTTQGRISPSSSVTTSYANGKLSLTVTSSYAITSSGSISSYVLIYI